MLSTNHFVDQGNMPYTLWSHDRLLGQSELDYMQVRDRHMIGDFEPTALGESLMPLVTGELQEFQLRAPDGSPLPIEWIDVRDTELLLSLIRDEDEALESEPNDPELEAAIDHDVALIEEWFSEKESGDQGWDAERDTEDDSWQERQSIPRYQIQVLLAPESAASSLEKEDPSHR